MGSPLIDACADSTPPGRAHLRRADEAATQAAAEAAQGGARLGRAPDIGAYEFGDRVYWMPGRRAHCHSLLAMAVVLPMPCILAMTPTC